LTTKDQDVGTGLGLSISREIIERAGGTITVESPADHVGEADGLPGTRFSIVLPAAGRGQEVAPTASPVPRGAAPEARVLIVEDEAALARALCEELGRAHAVTVARSATEALAFFERERFDAVLCDLRMPGMSGEALYAEMESRDAVQAERFIFMTGVGFGADVERFLASSGRPVLEKPFPAEAALEVIAKVVSRSRGGRSG